MTEAPSVIWQGVEYGSYDADLPLWDELAAAYPSPILELGCGIGRVTLRLARRGREVWGIDVDRKRLEELRRRGREEDLAVHAVVADASRFSLDGQSFGLVLAPMQLAELLGASAAHRMVEAAARHLRPGGLLAVAVLDPDDIPAPGTYELPSPLPDVRELGGWVFSSLPIRLEHSDGRLLADRLRQVVSPDGELTEERDRVTLERLGPDRLETMAADAGLRCLGRRLVPPTESHLGSLVVLAEAPDG
jgi:SAM-dependent methyltransferase